MVYFMMRLKLLHRMKEVCGATSHMMKDEFIEGEHQVDGTQISIIYIYTKMYLKNLPIFASQLRCYCILYLLSFIVTMYWTKFQYEFYSNSRVLVYYIEGHFLIYFLCQ